MTRTAQFGNPEYASIEVEVTRDRVTILADETWDVDGSCSHTGVLSHKDALKMAQWIADCVTPKTDTVFCTQKGLTFTLFRGSSMLPQHIGRFMFSEDDRRALMKIAHGDTIEACFDNLDECMSAILSEEAVRR